MNYIEKIIEENPALAPCKEAMEAVVRSAKEGDAVLLSPACASFDLFKSYEHRGRMFKEWICENILN